MHIRAYLFMMATGILIPVILFSGMALNLLRNAERDAALGSLRETANSVALRLERELYSAEASLKVLAVSSSLARKDYAAFYNEALITNRGSAVWTVLLDASGQQLINTSVPYGEALPASMDAIEAGALIAGGVTAVSDLERGARSRKLITSVNVPAAGQYVLRQSFADLHFSQLLAAAKVPPGWLVALIDRNGKFVARSVNAATLIGQPARPELVAAARAANRGQIRHHTLEGTESYDVFTHCTLSGWTVAVAAPVDMIERSARQASYIAAMGLLAAVMCAAALAAFFGRQHVRSIGQAVKAALELGNGVLPHRFSSRVLEVDELHGALYAAGEQLRQAQAYRKNAEAERQGLLEREQAARMMAEQQNTAKDQFLAMLGHELRNPLAPISTAAQLLKLQSNDASKVRYASDVITRQVDHMNSLLGDMLDVSRVTRGLVTLTLEQVDIKAVIERAIEQTAGLIELKRHQLSLASPPEPLYVRGDKTRLIQIFANLLNNAAKYTHAGGAIGLSATVVAGYVVVTVHDNGEGFSAELLPRLFDLFSQGERRPDRSQGGLGLGLALVKSLVQLHGGNVTAASPGPGKGSTFTVNLRCSVASVAGVTAAAPLLLGSNQLRVMIVEDNLDGAISLSMFLEAAGGLQVSTCHNGAEALEAAVREEPDIFILDIGLPDMTGYELAQRLKAIPNCAAKIFIALTGYGQAEDKVLAAAAGFNHHLAKPADPFYILSLLKRANQ